MNLQILAGANHEAIGTALAANLQFIRCEGFVFSHIADEGFMDGCAGELLRYRKLIDAQHIQIFTDIKKKHRYQDHVNTYNFKNLISLRPSSNFHFLLLALIR